MSQKLLFKSAAAITVAAVIALTFRLHANVSTQTPLPRHVGTVDNDTNVVVGVGVAHTPPVSQNAKVAAANLAVRPASTNSYLAQAMPPLPPPGTPLKEVLSRLRAAADHGDAQAACRVGIEMERCLRNENLGQSTPQYPVAAAMYGADSQQAADALAHDNHSLDLLDTMSTFCTGVNSADLQANTWRYLYNAASAGNVAAMSQFIRDPGLSFTEPASSADGWYVYRQEAPMMMTRAIDAGDVEATYFGWFSAATGLSTGGSGIFPKNPYKALVYGTAVLPYLDPARQQQVQTLDAQIAGEVTPADAQQAQAEGTALGTKLAISHGTRPFAASGNDGASDPAACAQ